MSANFYSDICIISTLIEQNNVFINKSLFLVHHIFYVTKTAISENLNKGIKKFF